MAVQAVESVLCSLKVKCQCTTFILATLVDLPSPMICAKIQPQGILGSGEEDFKRFYYIWAWRPSWSNDSEHFNNLLFPQPKEAPYGIRAKLAQPLQMSRLKMLTNGQTHEWTTDKKLSL